MISSGAMTAVMALRGLAAAALILGGLGMARAATVSASLNGPKITLDQASGAMLRLEYPGPGVNLTPFISVLQASPRTAGRYGLKVTDNSGWTYHTEMIPRWNPPYATGLSCVQVGPANARWQDEVAEACRRWADKGLRSVSWDQYWTAQEKPTMQDLRPGASGTMRGSWTRSPPSAASRCGTSRWIQH